MPVLATGAWPPHAACSDIALFSSMSGSSCLACSSVTDCRALLLLLLLLGSAATSALLLELLSVRIGRGAGRIVAACLISSKPSSCSSVWQPQRLSCSALCATRLLPARSPLSTIQ
jgi:hypothetical protein